MILYQTGGQLPKRKVKFPPNPIPDSLKNYRDPELMYHDYYNTDLGDLEESAYQIYLDYQNRERGRDLDWDQGAYDGRGFWRSGASLGSNGHATDTYKKPNHPTFSNESKYADQYNPGGVWSPNKPYTYTPSNRTKSLYRKEQIQYHLQDDTDQYGTKLIY